MFLKFIVCLIAGIGAGLGTGFAGMSAAAVISPMLITFLDMDPYIAVGIALAIDVKNGIVMMIFVLLFTLVGSFVSSKVPSTAMGNFSFVMTLFLGIKFIVKPVTEPKARLTEASDKQKIIRSALSGCMVGFICGFVGAGGGMMMLLVLTSVLGYELKTAVGTSVFVMAFTAFTGSVSHFAIGGLPDVWTLVFCMISTLIFAQIASLCANKAKPETLNRISGVLLVILGITMIIVNIVKLEIAPNYFIRRIFLYLQFRASVNYFTHISLQKRTN